MEWASSIVEPFVNATMLHALSGTDKNFENSLLYIKNFRLTNPNWYCVPESVQMMPVWTGGVFSFVKAVFPSYVAVKARVANLLSVATWTFDSVDPLMHPQWLEENYWKNAPFTLFVFCPFDVTKGGFDRGEGKMTFGDFYQGVCVFRKFSTNIVNHCRNNPKTACCGRFIREKGHEHSDPESAF